MGRRVIARTNSTKIADLLEQMAREDFPDSTRRATTWWGSEFVEEITVDADEFAQWVAT